MHKALGTICNNINMTDKLIIKTKLSRVWWYQLVTLPNLEVKEGQL